METAMRKGKVGGHADRLALPAAAVAAEAKTAGTADSAFCHGVMLMLG